MGLFSKRPLCFFCFLFLLTSVLASYFDNIVGFVFLICVSALAVIVTLLCVLIKKKRVVLFAVLLCICSVLCATLNDYVRIDIKQKQAREYIGNRHTCMVITDKNYLSEHSSAYTVKIENISGEKASVKAILITAFPVELNVGDVLRAQVELTDTTEDVVGISAVDIDSDADVLLCAALYQPEHAEVKYFNKDAPWYEYIFYDNGLSVAVFEAKSAVTSRIDRLLNSEVSGLAKAFLLGDKSDMQTDTVRDFRRTGLSHVFAVSGMHISILLGSVELLLRKLYVHKYIRCAFVALAAVPMLALTGFAMSAIRSVLMLYTVYLFYILSEESDGPTRLFTAISFILLAFPYAVYDLGLWLSFFATLAIVTVFYELREKYHGKKHEPLIRKLLRNIFLVAALTVLCNIFLLPLQWDIFGELSLVSLPANVIISPLTGIFMLAIIIMLALGSVPFIGSASVVAVKGIGALIESIVAFLSRTDLATVSLRYKFADILVVLFTVSFAAVLVLKLRRKWLVAIPPVAFAASFAACVLIFNLCAPARVKLYSDKNSELLSVSQGASLAIVDMSSGAYSRYTTAMRDAADMGTTTLDKLIFTKINKNHLSSMEYFFKANIVKSVYIPIPTDPKQKINAVSMAALADECGVTVYLYESGEIISHGEYALCIDDTILHISDGQNTARHEINSNP